MDQAPTCARYKIRKAECLSRLGRFQEAQQLATAILQLDKGNADAIYVRGLCLMYEDNIDSAVNHFQQVLRLAPDNKKAIDAFKRAKALKKKKDEGNAAFKASKFQDALELYSQALQIDPDNKITNAKLHFNRATVLSKLNKLQEAIADCTAALNLDESYLKVKKKNWLKTLILVKLTSGNSTLKILEKVIIVSDLAHSSIELKFF